jgi:hypothetical protein
MVSSRNDVEFFTVKLYLARRSGVSALDLPTDNPCADTFDDPCVHPPRAADRAHDAKPIVTRGEHLN